MSRYTIRRDRTQIRRPEAERHEMCRPCSAPYTKMSRFTIIRNQQTRSRNQATRSRNQETASRSQRTRYPNQKTRSRKTRNVSISLLFPILGNVTRSNARNSYR
eukprot:2250259-Rhodomonas_salina.1